LNQLSQRVKDDLDVMIVGIAAFFELAQFVRDVSVAHRHLTQGHERTHDGDVNLHGALTFEHGGEHGDTLLRERVGPVAAASTACV
jgi:hypothetical protein